MKIKGVNLRGEALKALRNMQVDNSVTIQLYLKAIDSSEDILLTPDGLVPHMSDEEKLETLRLLRYLKKDLATLIVNDGKDD